MAHLPTGQRVGTAPQVVSHAHWLSFAACSLLTCWDGDSYWLVLSWRVLPITIDAVIDYAGWANGKGSLVGLSIHLSPGFGGSFCLLFEHVLDFGLLSSV